MAETRPHRIQVWISDRDLDTLASEAEKQHRRTTNLAAAIIAEKCKEIREQNSDKKTIL